MKKGIHPQLRPIIFRDSGDKSAFLVQSTAQTDKTITHSDGKEYPLVEIEISSATHPFYTGTEQLIDTSGRIERFNTRYKISTEKKKS